MGRRWTVAESSKILLIHSPTGVPPGSRASTMGIRRASRNCCRSRICVVFPHPSIPSNDMKGGTSLVPDFNWIEGIGPPWEVQRRIPGAYETRPRKIPRITVFWKGRQHKVIKERGIGNLSGTSQRGEFFCLTNISICDNVIAD